MPNPIVKIHRFPLALSISVLKFSAMFNNKTLRRAIKLYLNNPNLAIDLHGPINSWDVSNVTDMNRLFRGSSFNDDIRSWNTCNVRNMKCMFKDAKYFNKPLPWCIDKVVDMSSMFKGATSFNQSLYWNTDHVKHVFGMFKNATSFDQSLSWSFDQISQLGLSRSMDLDHLCDINIVQKSSMIVDRRVSIYKAMCVYLKHRHISQKQIVPFEMCTMS